MFNLNYIFTGAVIVIAVGQITFKYAAQQLRVLPSQTYPAMLLENICSLSLVAVALLLYLISTIAWVQVLRTVPLSVAFMFNSLAFVLVPAAGLMLFEEPVPRFFLLGLALIIGGIILVSHR